MTLTPSEGTTLKARPVTVIALCYNHERFVIECLESIRAQTFQDFELIITDDCSRDSSPELITNWLAQNRPDGIFIRHDENRGLCRTLNEAISHSHGEFLSMIATDDAWEPDKIERQLNLMRLQPSHVAVVYSDAAQVDEEGRPLHKTVIEGHHEGLEPPSGKIFSTLADGNFIPAMATLIRRQAIDSVGGYDEGLTYEDYDMWLRLAQHFDFVFCPGTVARYRIVATSIVRTIFIRPTLNHSYSVFLIHSKSISSNLLTPAQRKRWSKNIWDAAYILYLGNDIRARRCLWVAFWYTKKPRALLLALACSLGISRNTAHRMSLIFGGGPK